MAGSSTEEHVREIICEQLGVRPEEVTSEASFIEDLGADSLDIVELVMALEEEYDAEISDEDIEKIRTVKDVISYIDGQQSPSPLPPSPPSRPPLPARGYFTEDCILVIGRTGAGKSSLINMLKGENVLPTGDIGSTTRWLEGVQVDLGRRTVSFVDSPGIGEALRDSDYHNGIKDWFSKNSSRVRCLLLVLQADAKAHADDKRLVDALRSVSSKPLIIALNHADKIKPVRQEFTCKDWKEEQKRSSLKSRNVIEKIEVVKRQFGRSNILIVPVVSEFGFQFNRNELARVILEKLGRG